MTHRIQALSVSAAIDEAEVEAIIDRAVDCSIGGHPQVCAGILAEDHTDAIKVLVALTQDSYEEARLLCDRLEIRTRAGGVTYAFPGVTFDGPLTSHDEAGDGA